MTETTNTAPADETTDTAATTSTETAEAAKPAETEETLEQVVQRLTAEARKWEQRAKENKTAAGERDKAKTEAESFQERLKALEDENVNLKRATVAAKFGLNDALASRLKGVTTEELEADAKELIESLPAGTFTPPTGVATTSAATAPTVAPAGEPALRVPKRIIHTQQGTSTAKVADGVIRSREDMAALRAARSAS